MHNLSLSFFLHFPVPSLSVKVSSSLQLMFYFFYLMHTVTRAKRGMDNTNHNGRVATNLQTGLDLRTGPSCCENTNLRTGLDQWTRQSIARDHGLYQRTCAVSPLTRTWEILKNDTWGHMHAELTTKSHCDSH